MNHRRTWAVMIFLSAILLSKGAIAATAPTPKDPSDEPKRRVTFDWGLAGGSSGGASYFEANVGMNYFLTRVLSWRNAVFYRFGSSSTQIFGLDSSFRVNHAFALGEDSAMRLHAGTGFRAATGGGSAPFAEAGLGALLGPVNVSFGVKYLMYSVMNSANPNEFQYMIGLSGGT